jgi:hypothetical protein
MAVFSDPNDVGSFFEGCCSEDLTGYLVVQGSSLILVLFFPFHNEFHCFRNEAEAWDATLKCSMLVVGD